MNKKIHNLWHDDKEQILLALGLVFLSAVVVLQAFGVDVVRGLFIIIGLIAAISLFFWPAKEKVKIIMFLAVVVGIFLLMLFGLNTGFIFNNLSYQEKVGVMVFKTPIVIGVLGFLVTLSAWQIASLVQKKLWVNAVVAGLLIVMFDMVFQQFGTSYDLWYWWQGGVTVYNFVFWFVVGFGLSLIYQKFSRPKGFSIFVAGVLPVLALFLWAMLLTH